MYISIDGAAIVYGKKEECYGCAACAAICPQKAIQMEIDEEGFCYPLIDESICLKCKLCLSVCCYAEDNF